MDDRFAIKFRQFRLRSGLSQNALAKKLVCIQVISIESKMASARRQDGYCYLLSGSNGVCLKMTVDELLLAADYSPQIADEVDLSTLD